MILLAVNQVVKHYGPEPVLAGVTFDVRPGERIGLVGPNGAGKTTLLHILAGIEALDSGTVQLHGSARMQRLEQRPDLSAGHTVWEEARSALSDLIDCAEQAEAVAQAIGGAEDESERRRLGARLDLLHHKLHQRRAYNLDHKIERVLEGLGTDRGAYGQRVETLSGGQQNRLMLAKLLLSEPDLMLLDEPSNHLDVSATQWLEGFLAETKQSLILVSHDRYLLDKVTTRTLELFHGNVEAYPGNFSAYWRQKAERLEVQRRTYEKQQTEIAKLKDFIRRNRYGQKHAQAEDRNRKLQRIEPVDPPRQITAPMMGFPPASRTGDIVLRIEHLSKAYAAPLFDDLSLEITRGEKWGILGPNGCGKTTLLRCVLGTEQPDAGRVIFGTGVAAGYFDQLLEYIDTESQVVEAIRPANKELPQQQRRDMLARFGLTGEMVLQSVASLSGGERNRVALARLAASEANFLLLDEPTNHLDLWALNSLDRSLRQFDGSVLLVSHDRYFLNQVVDHLLVFQPDRTYVIDGNYDTYMHLAGRGLIGQSTSDGPQRCSVPPEKRASGKTSPESSARRKRRFPYRKVDDLETDIFRRESRIEQLHKSLASPELLRDGQRVKEVKAEIGRQRQALALLYEHWEEASELN